MSLVLPTCPECGGTAKFPCEHWAHIAGDTVNGCRMFDPCPNPDCRDGFVIPDEWVGQVDLALARAAIADHEEAEAEDWMIRSAIVAVLRLLRDQEGQE